VHALGYLDHSMTVLASTIYTWASYNQ